MQEKFSIKTFWPVAFTTHLQAPGIPDYLAINYILFSQKGLVKNGNFFITTKVMI